MSDVANDGRILDPATGIFFASMVIATIVWFCFPPMVWVLTENDCDTWSLKDYKVDRDKCKEIFRKNNLCFWVPHFEKNEANEEEGAIEPSSNTALSNTGKITDGGDRLVVEHDGHLCIDIEGGLDSMLCVNIGISSDQGKVTNDGRIGESNCSFDDDDDEMYANDGGDNAMICICRGNITDGGVVLKIPNREDSIKFSDQFSASEVCAICIEKFKVGDELAFSNNKECRHVFHLDCISECIENTKGAEKACPCCRQCFLNLPMFLHDESNDVENNDSKKEEKATGS